MNMSFPVIVTTVAIGAFTAGYFLNRLVVRKKNKNEDDSSKSPKKSPVDAYDKLKDNVYIVTKNYFEASNHLKRHDSASQWTLCLLSLGLIILPLQGVTEIESRFSDNVINFASISMAVAVLVFSLLVGGRSYAVRAERMYRAGLALNDLARDLKEFESDPNKMSHYKGFDKRYGEILSQNENVAPIDYVSAKIRVIRKGPVPWKLRFEYWWRFCLGMLIYFIALLLEFGFIIASLWPENSKVVDAAASF